jgi:DNA topoisomerase I
LLQTPAGAAAGKDRLPERASLPAPGLAYSDQQAPGIRREPKGKSFLYRDPKGRLIRDGKTLARIRALAIPPAWTDVWICTDPDGHIQATGRDQRGRKQYRYHADWHEASNASKFERLLFFAEALPAIRARVSRDMAKPGKTRETVLATVVSLLDRTLIRVGNAEYSKANGSFGLTTIRNDHVEVRGQTLRFRFKGKSGKQWEVAVNDRRIARIVNAIQDLPGQDLFQYVDDDGVVRDVTSADVNAYIRDIAGPDVSAKDFRTWAGTVMAAERLLEAGPASSQREAKRAVTRAVTDVAHRLGNTVAVCRKSYIHPHVTECYLEGSLCGAVARIRGKAGAPGLPHNEHRVYRFLAVRARKKK